jgi:galactose mutarotase-like enzyme
MDILFRIPTSVNLTQHSYFNLAAPGTYTVRADAPGFQPGVGEIVVVGEPYPLTENFQYPRVVRVYVGLSF